MSTKKLPLPAIQFDLMGSEIEENDLLAVAQHNILWMCRCVTIHPKKLRVIPIGRNSGYDEGFLVYPCNVLRIKGSEATAWLLKNL